MRHPTDGTLRRLVDEPAGVADADREHVAQCPVCLSGLAAAQADAEAAGVALDVEFAADVDEGYRRLSRSLAADGGRRVNMQTPRVGRWRAALRSPALAVFGVVVVVSGAGAAAASDWLRIFHAEQITPIRLTAADLVGLPDLTAYGDVNVLHAARVREVAGAAAAKRATGLPVPQVSGLPQGVTGEPEFEVLNRVGLVFTFSAEKAERTAAAEGETLPPPPPGLDGSRFRILAGPGLAAVYSAISGLPGLVVARAVAPTAYSSGVPFDTARDYLLSLPGLPENLASQLRSVSGDGTTLPIPVPAGAATSTVDVDGSAATLFTSRDGAMTGVVWVEDGFVTAVAGSLTDDEVLSVARGLRWDQ